MPWFVDFPLILPLQNEFHFFRSNRRIEQKAVSDLFLSLWKVNQTICFVSQYWVDYCETQVIKLVTFAPLLVAKCFYICHGKGNQFMKPWVLAIYPNHTSGSLVH